MESELSKCGGYRKLHSFNLATITHLAVVNFCQRFIPWQNDPLGKIVGQMIGAARSGRINIAEGSERAATSIDTEIRLVDVARASLAELHNDLEMWLAQQDGVPWSILDPEYQAIANIRLESFFYTQDVAHDYWLYLHQERHKYDHWLMSDDPVIVANALIFLCRRTMALLHRQSAALAAKAADVGYNQDKSQHSAGNGQDVPEMSIQQAPACPVCGRPMRLRRSAKGPFWGCPRYPDCKGTRECDIS